MMQMAGEVEKSFMGEMMSQKANVEKVEASFLDNCRQTYLDWGCNRQCTIYNTSNLHRLGDMSMCDCPAQMTITGDTSIFMN